MHVLANNQSFEEHQVSSVALLSVLRTAVVKPFFPPRAIRSATAPVSLVLEEVRS